MIHEVRLSRENKIYLWQIVRLQLDVLSCAVTLAPGFTEQDLQDSLVQKMLPARAERVANWVWGPETNDPTKIKKTRKGLQLFVTGTETECQDLTESMCADVLRLFWARRNETLVCCFDDDKKLLDYKKGAKDFLIAFYDHLKSGIPTYLFACNPCIPCKKCKKCKDGKTCEECEKYGREQFFATYERDNPCQYICAICDEHRPVTVLRGSYLSDIEHYFPKSIYPHLACHPYNLMPICGACNSAHSDRDPLTPKNNGTRRTLGNIFLPYRNDSVRLQGLIKLEWNPSSNPHLSFGERLPNPAGVFAAKLEAFLEIYDIPDRWQKRIHSIGEQLWRQMSAYVRTEIDKDKPLDSFKVKTALERLLDYLIEDLGTSPWDFVLVWYLGHLLVADLETAIQANKSAEEIPLVKTLEGVLEQSKSKPTIILSADDVLETSRQIYTRTT